MSDNVIKVSYDYFKANRTSREYVNYGRIDDNVIIGHFPISSMTEEIQKDFDIFYNWGKLPNILGMEDPHHDG